MGTIFKALEKLQQNSENGTNSFNSFETKTLSSSHSIDTSEILERRCSIRKEKFFHGHIIESYLQGYVTQKLIKSKIIVKDLSMHGVRIKILENIPLKEGKNIEIEFKIDDQKKSKIIREVRIKRLTSLGDMGCEFLSTDHYGFLEKYFVSYF